MSSEGCQINPIDVNFQLQKSLKFFDRNSADKIQSQNYKGDKSAASCQLGLKIFLVKIKTLPGKTSLIVIEKSYELTVPSGTQCLSIS